MLFAFCLGNLPVFGRQAANSSESVFCPLQKKWVPRGGTDSKSPPKQHNLLAGICAPQKIKNAFFDESVVNLRFLRRFINSEQTETLFFRYAEKGKRAFAEIRYAPNFPEPQFSQAAAVEKSLVNRQKDFGKRAVERFVFKQLARPPTIAPKTFTEHQNVRELASVPRSIQPRAPPVRS